MKKIVMLIGVMVLVVSLLLPACTRGGAPKGDLPASISYGTLPMGTTFHTTGIAHADVIKNHTGMEVFIEPVSNPVAILIQLLQAKELDAAITMGFHTWYSFGGKPGSAPNIRDLRTLFRWTQFRYGYIARADAGIKTMKDLKGKKVSALWPANAAFQDLVNETLLGAYGMTLKDIVAMEYSNPAEGMRGMIEGKYDAHFGSLAGGAMHEELASTVGGLIIPIDHDPKIMDYITARTPFLAPATVPAGTALTKSGAVPVVADNSFVSVHKDMDEYLAYTLVKTLIENNAELVKINPGLAEGTLENATGRPEAPFHPGAVKYYKEKGVWTSELDALQNKLLAK